MPSLFAHILTLLLVFSSSRYFCSFSEHVILLTFDINLALKASVYGITVCNEQGVSEALSADLASPIPSPLCRCLTGSPTSSATPLPSFLSTGREAGVSGEENARTATNGVNVAGRRLAGESCRALVQQYVCCAQAYG